MIISLSKGQVINRAPHFVPVTGDMSQFSMSENTAVGTPVYQLKGKQQLDLSKKIRKLIKKIKFLK